VARLISNPKVRFGLLTTFETSECACALDLKLKLFQRHLSQSVIKALRSIPCIKQKQRKRKHFWQGILVFTVF